MKHSECKKMKSSQATDRRFVVKDYKFKCYEILFGVNKNQSDSNLNVKS